MSKVQEAILFDIDERLDWDDNNVYDCGSRSFFEGVSTLKKRNVGGLAF